MKKVLFIDRDGTLINEPMEDPQIDSLDKLKFTPGVFTWLGRIARETGYELVMVSNQDGLGTASFPEETFWPVQNMIINTLAGEGIHFEAIHIDHSLPHENKPTRKPGIGMLDKYFSDQYDLKNSIVIGDRMTDVEMAKNLGATCILINDGSLQQKVAEMGLSSVCQLITHNWKEIY